MILEISNENEVLVQVYTISNENLAPSSALAGSRNLLGLF